MALTEEVVYMLLVSVIVPVYNAEAFLKRCIDSILAQTYENIELILIDDGSKDRSGAICDEYARIDTRIRVIHNTNSGVAETRNIGIKEAVGDYLSFVDSDDYIAPNMLETLVAKASEHNSDIVMCKYYIDRSGEIVCAPMEYDETYDGAERVKNDLLYLYYTDYHSGLYSLCNKIIKRSLYSSYGILFDPLLKRGEDAWFLFQCLKHCKRVDYVPEAFYYYCQNENSIMHTVYDNQYTQWVETRKRLLHENEELNFSINFDSFYKEFLYKVNIYCRELIKNGKKREAKQILSDDFFRNASKYSTKLPIHIRLITQVSRISPGISIQLLKLWGLG
ncbi:MAG: glycosyltransferase family 2 protein [Faecousia sp.]